MPSTNNQAGDERDLDFVALEMRTPRPNEAVTSNANNTTGVSVGRNPKSPLQKFIDTELPTLCSICFFAYCGVGARVLLTEFGTTIGTKQNDLLKQLGNSFFLANALGCFVMGFCVRCRNVLPKKLFKDLMTGITTGFCGCCTTFASWDLFVAKRFVHGQWADALLVLFVQIGSALYCFYGGCHLSEALLKFYAKHTKLRAQQSHGSGLLTKPLNDLPRLTSVTKRNVRQLHLMTRQQSDYQLSSIHMRSRSSSEVTTSMAFQMSELTNCLTKTLEQVAQLGQVISQQESQEKDVHMMVKHHGTMLFVGGTIVFWCLPWVGLAAYPKSLLLAVAVAPFGALIRYYLSLFNSRPQFQGFPLFTFIVNVGASILTCCAEIVGSQTQTKGQHAKDLFTILGSGMFMTGFLGSLSTVSTWINELDVLSGNHTFWAYRYGLVTLIISQLCSVFILSLWQTFGSAPLM